MWRGLRNFKDPAELLGFVGALGMFVFFMSLIVTSDNPPRWIVLPTFVLMTVGVFGEMIWKFVRGHRKSRRDREVT